MPISDIFRRPRISGRGGFVRKIADVVLAAIASIFSGIGVILQMLFGLVGFVMVAAFWIAIIGVSGWLLFSAPLWLTDSGLRIRSRPQCQYWAGLDQVVARPPREYGVCPLFRDLSAR
jgi:hypothetical protein